MKAPKSTPKEVIFLELGLLPLREVIKQRRMNFLYYLIHQKSDSMIKRIFEKQSRNRTPKDWITTVLKDIEELELNVTFEEIKQMSKQGWKNMVKASIKDKTFQTLEAVKQNHSKVRKLKHEKLELQSYFKPNKQVCSKEDIEMIFKLRSNMTNVKMNSKYLHETYECTMCSIEEESSEHIYLCNEIWNIKGKNKENIPNYESILNGSMKQKIEIAKIFNENMKILEKVKTSLGRPGDGVNPVCSNMLLLSGNKS